MLLLLNRWLPPAVWMLLIFFLSSQSHLPGPAGVAPNFLAHKIMHLFVYAVLYALLYRAVNYMQKKKTIKDWIVPFIFTTIYAATDEIHQGYVPGRTPAFHDIGYDILGASIAVLMLRQYI